MKYIASIFSAVLLASTATASLQSDLQLQSAELPVGYKATRDIPKQTDSGAGYAPTTTIAGLQADVQLQSADQQVVYKVTQSVRSQAALSGSRYVPTVKSVTPKAASYQPTTTTRRSTVQTSSSKSTVRPVSNRPSIRAAAYRLLGTRYVYGGMSYRGVDCSGFTSLVMKEAGIRLPRTSRAQYGVGSPVSRANLREGDLVFFATLGSGISHVGLYLGEGKFIHAENPRTGVVISSIRSGYYARTYVGARRVMF